MRRLLWSPKSSHPRLASASRVPLSRRTLLAAPFLLPILAKAADTEVAIAVSSTSFVLGGIKIGEQAGIFQNNGLRSRIIVMDSGNAALSALLGGSVHFSVSGPSEILAARARGQDVVIATNLYRGLAGSLVLSKATISGLKATQDAPIADRLRALDNVVISEPSATSALLGPYKAATEALGAHIRFTYMAQGAMPAALENNAIQGMVASFPFVGTPIIRGTGVLWIDGPGGELPAEVLPASSSCAQTTTAYAKENPDMIRRLRQTVADIAAFIETDPHAAQRALAAGYPQLSPQDIDLAFRQQWRNWTKPDLTTDDMRQELKLLNASVKLPGLDKLDPASALLPA
jgi:ABC-type nitrate/sulfonate/bicarbonate transport system substrate-binding protein